MRQFIYISIACILLTGCAVLRGTKANTASQTAILKEEKKAFLYHIFVKDAFRKQGIAQDALHFFENESKDEGADYVGLHVFGSNEQAIALFNEKEDVSDLSHVIVQLESNM